MKILLVDDHGLFVEGLTNLLRAERGHQHAGEDAQAHQDAKELAAPAAALP